MLAYRKGETRLYPTARRPDDAAQGDSIDGNALRDRTRLVAVTEGITVNKAFP